MDERLTAKRKVTLYLKDGTGAPRQPWLLVPTTLEAYTPSSGVIVLRHKLGVHAKPIHWGLSLRIPAIENIAADLRRASRPRIATTTSSDREHVSNGHYNILCWPYLYGMLRTVRITRAVDMLAKDTKDLPLVDTADERHFVEFTANHVETVIDLIREALHGPMSALAMRADEIERGIITEYDLIQPYRRESPTE